MKNYKTQFQSLGYNYDDITSTAYRKIDNFCFTIKLNISAKTCLLNVPCIIDESNASALNEELQHFISQRKKNIKSAFYNGNIISILYQISGMSMDISEGIKELTERCLYYMHQYGAVPSCSVCGKTIDTNIYAIEGNVLALCADCFSDNNRQLMKKMHNDDSVTENVPLGIVGAFLGGLLGAVLWILFSLMGMIVFIVPVAACFGGYFGYKKLGKKVSRKGLATAIIVAFVILLVGMYFSFALRVYNKHNELINEFNANYTTIQNYTEPNITFSDAFALVPEYISSNIGTVIHDYLIGIIIYLVAALVCVWQVINENKLKNRAIRLT